MGSASEETKLYTQSSDVPQAYVLGPVTQVAVPRTGACCADGSSSAECSADGSSRSLGSAVGPLVTAPQTAPRLGRQGFPAPLRQRFSIAVSMPFSYCSHGLVPAAWIAWARRVLRRIPQLHAAPALLWAL